MKRTKRQIFACKRNFGIMRLKGAIATMAAVHDDDDFNETHVDLSLALRFANKALNKAKEVNIEKIRRIENDPN